MKDWLCKKSIGFYPAALAGIVAVVSVVRFLMWAPSHKSMDMIVVAALAVGIVAELWLLFKDNDYLIILATACYSVALMKHLTNSVGSFVDAFQGINMFGDASQVGAIISIAAVMLVSIVLSIASGFLKRVNE